MLIHIPVLNVTWDWHMYFNLIIHLEIETLTIEARTINDLYVSFAQFNHPGTVIKQ